MEPTGTTAALIEQARQGERSAQEQLWREHRRWVAAIVLAHMPRSMEIDDLMQDVALKMIDKLDTLRDAAAFRPWMRRIIINTCRGAARNMKPTLGLAFTDRDHADDRHHGQFIQPASREANAAETVETSDAAHRVLEQVMSLPPEYREPLLLRCVQSLTYQQIGDILDLPLTTVETRLARARKMLREELGEELAEVTYLKSEISHLKSEF